jgi:hypothetical protein
METRTLSLADAKPVHARWAELNAEWLDFVERNPECLARRTFASIYDDAKWLRKWTMQPWPLFADEARRQEIETLALGIDKLMKGAIERLLLDSGTADLVAFFDADNSLAGETLMPPPSAEYLDMLLSEPDGIFSAASRGDYIDGGDGLKLLEYNAGSYLGGLQLDFMAELNLACGPVARFLEETGRRAVPPNGLRALFRHMAEDTADAGIWKDGPFNLAWMVHPNPAPEVALNPFGLYDAEFQKALADAGMEAGGRFLLCGPEQFGQEKGMMTVDGHPVHALMEYHQGTGDMRLPFRYFKMGRLNLFSGPVSWLMGDKRNVARVSEQAGSDEFTEEERELIRAHVPWTRRVLPGATTFRGRGFRLPDDLPAHREHLVLKKASSVGGRHVQVGPFSTDAQWTAAIARAVRERDWVVQEFVQTPPYFFQAGEEGAAPHNLVWGLFVFGEYYGGAFLRMQPAGRGTGVVNALQGAEVAGMLHLVD